MEVNLTVQLRMLLSAFSVVIFLSWTVCGLDNGLALTPPMGWLSWGKFRCKTDCRKHPRDCLSEKLFQEMADTLISDSYKAAGYEYINIDDCWMSRMRDPQQRLFPDPQRFPNGIQSIANYVHDRGLKLGIYNTFGKTTCMGFPGSLGFLELDAKTFAEWQVDMLKMDGCFTPTHLIPDGYMDMHRYLNATGRHILYSCSWPFYQRADGKYPNYNHIAKYCNIWRNSMDIEDSWESVLKIIDDFAAHQDAHIPAAGPGHFHDPDMKLIMVRITTTLAVIITLISVPRRIEGHAQPCPLYWTRFQNHCYRLFSNDGTVINQVEAESKCNQFSSCSGSLAHLPSASTPAEYDFLRVWLGGIIEDLTTDPVLTGLYSDVNGKFFGYDYTYINDVYPHMASTASAVFVIDGTGLATGTTSYYVCKMHTTGNKNFKDLYFETEEPVFGKG